MRKILFFLIILFLGISLFPIKSKADGGLFPPFPYRIQESGQKAVIFYEKGRETLIISITFKGNAKDFGWVIPVPQKPEITKGSDEIFTSLQEITQKHQREKYYGPIIMMAPGATRDEAVTVIETKKIDYYEITVLSATDAQALAKWLSDNDYQYPEESAYVLNDYISNQWYFVAVKISPEAEGANEVIQGLKEGHATPLKLEFNSEAIIYPLRISAIEFGQDIIKLSDNLILNQEIITHLKNIGYEDLTDKEKGVEIFNRIAEDLLAYYNLYGKYMTGKDDKPQISGEANKYKLIIPYEKYSKNFCTDLITCRGMAEEWFNDYFQQRGLFYSPSQQNYVPIHLYVIADGKKEIPGFTIDYANWISVKDIRKLAYDVNGKPLIDPKIKKHYLTYLYRNISTSEMTDDLILRPAENNQRINAPNPWLNLLWGCLIVLGIIILWFLSPFGIMFVTATLVRSLIEKNIAKVLGKVFQIISMIITFGLFIAFLVLIMYLKIAYFPILSAAIGFTLLLIGQIAIYIIQSKLTKLKQI